MFRDLMLHCYHFCLFLSPLSFHRFICSSLILMSMLYIDIFLSLFQAVGLSIDHYTIRSQSRYIHLSTQDPKPDVSIVHAPSSQSDYASLKLLSNNMLDMHSQPTSSFPSQKPPSSQPPLPLDSPPLQNAAPHIYTTRLRTSKTPSKRLPAQTRTWGPRPRQQTIPEVMKSASSKSGIR